METKGKEEDESREKEKWCWLGCVRPGFVPEEVGGGAPACGKTLPTWRINDSHLWGVHEVQSAVAWLPLLSQIFPCINWDRPSASRRKSFYHHDTAMQIDTSCPVLRRQGFKTTTETCVLATGYRHVKLNDTMPRKNPQRDPMWFSFILEVNVSVCDGKHAYLRCLAKQLGKKKKKSEEVILLWALPLYRDWCPLKFRLCQPAATSSRQGQIRKVNRAIYGSLPVKSSGEWKMALV